MANHTGLPFLHGQDISHTHNFQQGKIKGDHRRAVTASSKTSRHIEVQSTLASSSGVSIDTRDVIVDYHKERQAKAHNAPAVHSMNVVIAGGGPAGFLEAFLLAKAGHRVQVYEPDTRDSVYDLSERTKTYPVCISARGVAALKKAGLTLEGSSLARASQGLVVFLQNGAAIPQGNACGQFLVSRAALRLFLAQQCEQRFPNNIKIHYGCRLHSVRGDLNIAEFEQLAPSSSAAPTTSTPSPPRRQQSRRRVVYEEAFGASHAVALQPPPALEEPALPSQLAGDILKSLQASGQLAMGNVVANGLAHQRTRMLSARYDLLVGADGAHSRVRKYISEADPSFHSKLTTEKSQQFKTFSLPADMVPEQVKAQVQANKMFVFHHFSNSSMFMAPTSQHGLYRGILLMPVSTWERAESAEQLCAELLSRFGAHLAPSLAEYLAAQMLPQKARYAGNSVWCNKFHHENIVLLGDAAHGMLATYGQGANAALESAVLLAEGVEQARGCPRAVGPIFTDTRMDDAHVIVNMSRQAMLGTRPGLSVFYWAEFCLLWLQHALAPRLVDPPTLVTMAASTLPYHEMRNQAVKAKSLLYTLVGAACAACVIPGSLMHLH